MAVNLEKMSKQELEKLRSDIDKALAKLEDRRKSDALKAAEKAAKDLGFNLNELLGGSKKSARKSAAKYRNPADPNQTWAGRGRKPEWIKEAEAAGTDLSTFLA